MKSHQASSLRCKILAVVIPAIIVVIAVALGLGIGLKRGNSTSSTSPSSTATPLPIFNGLNTTNGTWWEPTVGETWQIVLLYPLNDTTANAAVYDIDLFINSASIISALHSQSLKAICYFSAGSYEDFRPDSGNFSRSDYGKPLDGWPGEWWVNTRSENVRNIMLRRLDLAYSKGCDGVDPDNIDGYENDNGLGLTQDDAVNYLSFLAEAAHARNLSIGLKNGGDILPRVLDWMQWEINEQCIKYEECGVFQPFIDAGKPVFHIEYPSSAPEVNITQKTEICDDESAAGFSTILKNMNLDDWVDACWS